LTCTPTGSPTTGKDKRTETFALTGPGLAAFYQTLTEDTSVLIEATITTFSFARLFGHLVKEVIVANTYELKQISLARCNTGQPHYKTPQEKEKRADREGVEGNNGPENRTCPDPGPPDRPV
jgi:hypothetical protein